MKRKLEKQRLHQDITFRQIYSSYSRSNYTVESYKKDEELLASCYRECLRLAADTGAESIAFCCLSTGVFRFPQQRAAEIATNTVKQYLDKDSRIKR